MRRVALTLCLVAVGLAHVQTAVGPDTRAAVAESMNGTAIPVANGSMCLLTDDSRTPLAALPAGTNVSARPQAVASRQRSSWSDRGYLSLNGAWQTTSNGFTGASTITQNVEAGRVTTAYGGARPLVVDVSGAVRVWRNLAVGATVTWLSQATDANVSATIPHPFLFNAPRTVAGDVAGLPRRELALHVNASWVVPAGRRAQVAVFGGPSYFQVRQALVTDVGTSSTYPYDTATFVDATTVATSKSRVGFHGGLDITARVWRHVGVGAIVRYSRATLQFPAGSDEEVMVRAGGLQVGGGIRLAY